jgi:hypothetical protein
MWKSVVGAWLNVRPGLTKADPTNSAETLRQPFFGNPLILNASGVPLGLGSLRDGSAFCETRMLTSQRHVEPRGKRLEESLRTGNELPRIQQAMQKGHHRQHPVATRRMYETPQQGSGSASPIQT